MSSLTSQADCTDEKVLLPNGYDVQTTAPNSSNEIGGAERMHRTITYAIRTMLHAAGLPYAFWPYALQHFVAISNSLPQGDRPMSPVEMCSGRKNDLSLARIFGCRCYALPTSRRPATFMPASVFPWAIFTFTLLESSACDYSLTKGTYEQGKILDINLIVKREKTYKGSEAVEASPSKVTA